MHAPIATLGQDEAFARIRLLRSPHIGPVSYAQLLARFGDAVSALEALPDLARKGGREYRAAPADRIEREVEAVRRAGARYLFHDQPSYPRLLAELESLRAEVLAEGTEPVGHVRLAMPIGLRERITRPLVKQLQAGQF